jgi:hypothetical protein
LKVKVLQDRGTNNPSRFVETSQRVPIAERTAKTSILLLELLLVAAVVHQLRIESQRHFSALLGFVICGFVVHTYLPMKVRLGFFGLLSIASVLLILGLENGLRVLGTGGVLIGICYLPIRYAMRIALLVATGLALAFTRARFPLPFWPILGSMFMFRLMIFLYDCRRETTKPSWSWSLSYFFMMPNVCFPLFPVVDFKTLRQTWYNEGEWEIYQRGVTWIFRGIVHLLLYRVIKSYVVPDADQLVDVQSVALFVVTNFALYLQVSGQFHLITGLLHLFGFNLPRTHDHYFLASSFRDIWSRINIYWKNFMAKMFFFPVFFAMRHRGTPMLPAIVFGVLAVFVCTWLFHSWQTFWLLGRFPLSANDATLWLGVGVCVAINAVLDTGKSGTNMQRSAWNSALYLSVRTVMMFLLVSLFWACWTKPGFLVLIAGVMGRPGAVFGLLVVLAWLLLAVAVGMLIQFAQRSRLYANWKIQQLDFAASVKLHLSALAVILVLLSTWSSHLFAPNVAEWIAAFRVGQSETEEDEKQLKSYYEDLNMAAIQAGPLLNSFSPQTEARRTQALGFNKVSRTSDAYQGLELIPKLQTELEGRPFTVNEFGMRDRRTLARTKPTATTRIALVGSSIVMGYGVSDEETFARVLETRLNNEFANSEQHFEVLNFGVGKQWAPHRLIRIQRQVVGFEPSVLFYFAHQDEFQELASHTAQLVSQNLRLPSKHIQAVATLSKVSTQMAPGAIQSRLMQHEPELLTAVYRSIVDECRNHEIVPVWIYLPVPSPGTDQTAPKLIPVATDAGFIVCNLSDWTHNRDDLFPNKEHHPNAQGHQLIAEALMRMIKNKSEIGVNAGP